MDTGDGDGRGGDDPLKKGFTVVHEKRKLRSDYQTKYDFEHGVDTKRNKTINTTEEQNGGLNSGNKAHDKSHTNTQKQHTAQTDKQTRQNKDRTDAVYNDGWIKNTDYTTFVIEREKIEGIGRDVYPHPMEVAKMLKNIKADNYKEMKSVGRGRFQLTFNKPRDAEQLINSKLLKEEFKFKVYVPAMFKQTVGMVRDVAKSLSEQEILENMHSGNIKIEKVERMMKKVEDKLVPTYSIKIYAKGQYLPRSVEIYGQDRLCEPYVFPLKICYKCWRYGHGQKFCKASSVKCCKCGMEHEEKDCNAAELKCINCGGAHKASDRECPEWERQDKIRVEMAKNKISYFEAQQKHPKKQKSVQNRLNSNKEFPRLPEKESGNIYGDETENDHEDGAWGYTAGTSWSSVTENGLLTRKPKKKMTIQPKVFPKADLYEEAPHVFKPNPHTTSETERMVHRIKQELIAQFNLKGIVDKIKAIQDTILKSTNKTENIEQDLVLINISNQLNSILNPEICYENEIETNNNGPEQTQKSKNHSE